MSNTTPAAALDQAAIDSIVDGFENAYQDAVQARERITAAGLAYIGWKIRLHLPTATAIAVKVDSLSLAAVHGPDGVLWADGDGGDLDALATDEIGSLLTDVLTFGRDEEALEDLGWTEHDGKPGVYTAPLPELPTGR